MILKQFLKDVPSNIVRLSLDFGSSVMYRNTVLQSENDLFEPEIQPNSHENCEFLALIRTIKSSKCLGHCPVLRVFIIFNL